MIKHRYAVEYAVFAVGASVMMLEILGFGTLAPYFGNSLLVNSNLIGLILTSLAFGYRLGGKWGDAHATQKTLSAILFYAALWIGFIFPFRDIVSSVIGSIIPVASIGSFFTTLILFTPAGVMMGMALPYAIKIYTPDIASSGRTSGRLYALSAAGSIGGTLLVGFVLLPYLGANAALFISACLLASAAIGLRMIDTPNNFKKTKISCLLLILTIALLWVILFFVVPVPEFLFHQEQLFSDGKIDIPRASLRKLAEENSVHSRIQVYEGMEANTQKPVRIMMVNGEMHSASYLDSNQLVFNYAQFNRLGGHFNPVAKRALLIGGGAYSYANYFLTDTPLYDVEKIWELENKLYYNNKTISLPVLISDDWERRTHERELVYQSSDPPEGRAIEGARNYLEADNQNPAPRVIVKRANILDTGFSDPKGYVHIHETKDDGTPGRIISPDIYLNDTPQYPRSIIGKSALIGGINTNVEVPLDRAPREGEVLYPMLHRDNENGHFDDFLVDGYEQIEGLDVVEIDPHTTKLAAEYFHLNLGDPRLRIFHEDGRTFINRASEKYDIIYIDAFRSFYSVPWQLTTVEATRKIYSMLNANGVVVANVPAALRGRFGKFFQAELKTYRSVFPEVRAYAVLSPAKEEQVQNIIIVAFQSNDNIRATPNDDPQINEHLAHEWKGTPDPDVPILTDDFAPTDYFTNKFANLHSF